MSESSSIGFAPIAESEWSSPAWTLHNGQERGLLIAAIDSRECGSLVASAMLGGAPDALMWPRCAASSVSTEEWAGELVARSVDVRAPARSSSGLE